MDGRRHDRVEESGEDPAVDAPHRIVMTLLRLERHHEASLAGVEHFHAQQMHEGGRGDFAAAHLVEELEAGQLARPTRAWLRIFPADRAVSIRRLVVGHGASFDARPAALIERGEKCYPPG